jgi:hypothetical protein
VLDDGGPEPAVEAMRLQSPTGMGEGAARGTGKGDQPPSPTHDLDDLGEGEVGPHAPGTTVPGTEVDGERAEVLAQTIGKEDRDMAQKGRAQSVRLERQNANGKRNYPSLTR